MHLENDYTTNEFRIRNYRCRILRRKRGLLGEVRYDASFEGWEGLRWERRKALNILQPPSWPWTCPSSPGSLTGPSSRNETGLQWRRKKALRGASYIFCIWRGWGRGRGRKVLLGVGWLTFLSGTVPQRVRNAVCFRAACQRYVVSYSLHCSSFVL